MIFLINNVWKKMPDRNIINCLGKNLVSKSASQGAQAEQKALRAGTARREADYRSRWPSFSGHEYGKPHNQRHGHQRPDGRSHAALPLAAIGRRPSSSSSSFGESSPSSSRVNFPTASGHGIVKSIRGFNLANEFINNENNYDMLIKRI